MANVVYGNGNIELSDIGEYSVLEFIFFGNYSIDFKCPPNAYACFNKSGNRCILLNLEKNSTFNNDHIISTYDGNLYIKSVTLYKLNGFRKRLIVEKLQMNEIFSNLDSTFNNSGLTLNDNIYKDKENRNKQNKVSNLSSDFSDEKIEEHRKQANQNLFKIKSEKSQDVKDETDERVEIIYNQTPTTRGGTGGGY